MIKLGLVIASHGRPDLLQQIVTSLSSQRRIPDTIVISAVAPADITASTQALSSVRTIFGSAGLTCQRNRGISCLIDTVDVIAFIDDDFIVGHDYFHNMERLFEHDELIIGINAEIIADGADSPGFTFEEGLRLAEQYRRQKTEPVAREITGKYADGCNGIIAFRSTRAGALRFDERLPRVALRRLGRIVRTNLIWGVHLGTKRGKGSEVQLGYSQIVNPAYIVSKGNMSVWYALQLAARNVAANIVRSIRPESYVDRRGRLQGNVIGMFHLIAGRLTPEYILKLR